MMGRIFTAYEAELLKAMRWKYTYVGPVLVMLMVALAPLLQSIGDGVNSYVFIAFATPAALNVLGLFLLVSFCAGLVSSETGSGTIRLLLTRPLLRHEFLAAKLLMGATYALLLTVATALMSWGLAGTFGRLEGVEYGGEVLYTGGYMVRVYLTGLALSLAPQLAFVAYAVMISTLVKNTGAAVVTSIGIWLLLDAVKYPLGISKMLFASYVDTPWSLFRSCCEGMEASWGSSAVWCLGTSAVAFALFSTVSAVSLHRRNLHA